MKKLIGKEITLFLKKADEKTGLKLLGDIRTNLYDIQKKIMTKRLLLFSIFGFYLLLIQDIITVSKLPGISGEIDNLLMFSSLNNIFLCFIPAVYVANHWAMVHGFIYRSQMRLFHDKLSAFYYPEITNSRFHLYGQPYSPGMNLKNLLQIREQPDSEKKYKVKSSGLRWLFKNSESILTWLFIPAMFYFNLARELNVAERYVFMAVIIATILSIWFATVKLLILYHKNVN